MKGAKYIAIYLVIVIIINIFMPVTIAIDTVNEIENDDTTKTTEESDIDNKIEENTIEDKVQSSNNYEQNETQNIEAEKELENKQGQEDITLEMKHSETMNDTEETLKEFNIDEQLETIETIDTTNPSQPIENGIYKIKTNVGANMYLDIDGGSKAAGANLQIWSKSDVLQQRFLVTKIENGYYKITAVHSKNVLDVNNAGKINGTNVKQYTDTGSDAQQWIIKKVEGKDNCYNIISKCNNLYLDIFGAYGSNGTNVQMYTKNGSNAQEFVFEEVKKAEPIHTLDDGTYKIKASVGTNMYLDIDGGSKVSGANLQIWEKSNVKQQKFQIEDIGSGYYKITAVHSGQALEVNDAGKANGTNVQQNTSINTEEQQWIIKQIEGETGYYNIISKCNGLYLDVCGGYSNNGTNVQMYEENLTNSQKFKFEKLEDITPEHTVENGIYKIKANVGTNMYLDIDGGSKESEANLQIWKTNNVEQQKFQITDIGEGYYKITAIHSGKVLDVNNAGNSNGTNVKQYIDIESEAQKWIIKKVVGKENYYKIISKCNDIYLDVDGGRSNNGTNVQMYEGNGSNAQEFKFEKVENIEGEYSISEGNYKIVSAINENAVLDIDKGTTIDGANLQVWQKSNVKQQIFSVKYIGSGLYTIEVPYSNKVLDVNNAGTTNGTNVKQYTFNGSSAQKWIIKTSEQEGYYYIISECNKIYLDVANDSAANGTNIQMYERKEGKSQLFKFEKYDADKEPITYDGTYRISTALSYRTNMALDIDGGSKSAKANLQIWGSTNVLQQKFRITYIGDNCYTIQATHSNMYLEAENNGTKVGTNVCQNVRNANSDSQKWIIEDAGNGYYYIKSKLNNLYLDVFNGSNEEGTNVWLYSKNNTDSQKFKLEEIYFGVDVSKWNGEINYDSLASSNRADFVIARTGYTTEAQPLVVDEQFERNYREAKARKIPLGTYVYSYADTVQEVQTQTLALIQYFQSNNFTFELPIFFDIEDANQAKLSVQERTDLCNTFCNILRNYGYKPGIYSMLNWIQGGIYINQIPSDVSIWVASYGYKTENGGYSPSDIYKYAGNHDIWQFTSRGNIDGVSGVVDVDITYKRMW